MSDLADQFAAAAEAAKQLPEKPANADLLRLYALYKQGKVGNVTGDRPGMMDIVGRAKYDARADLTGMGRDDAVRAYVALVASLQTG
jgi:acyl-CoA-binding protein